MIFNENDNDSLSSTGVCTEVISSLKGSQATLTNRSIHNLRIKQRNSPDDKDYGEVEQSSLTLAGKQESFSSHLETVVFDGKKSIPGFGNQQQMPPDVKDTTSSISDIDPDEDILKNLLVKNQKKS